MYVHTDKVAVTDMSHYTLYCCHILPFFVPIMILCLTVLVPLHCTYKFGIEYFTTIGVIHNKTAPPKFVHTHNIHAVKYIHTYACTFSSPKGGGGGGGRELFKSHTLPATQSVWPTVGG